MINSAMCAKRWSHPVMFSSRRFPIQSIMRFMLVGFDMSSWNDIVECDSFYYWPSSLSDKLAVNQTDLVSNNCKNPVAIFSALSYVMIGHLDF